LLALALRGGFGSALVGALTGAGQGSDADRIGS